MRISDWSSDVCSSDLSEKRARIADWLKAQGRDAAVISALDSIAWLLNIRGQDVDHTPVALSFLIAHANGTAELFIAPEKVTPEIVQHPGNAGMRSEERRGGKECDCRGRSR